MNGLQSMGESSNYLLGEVIGLQNKNQGNVCECDILRFMNNQIYSETLFIIMSTFCMFTRRRRTSFLCWWLSLRFAVFISQSWCFSVTRILQIQLETQSCYVQHVEIKQSWQCATVPAVIKLSVINMRRLEPDFRLYHVLHSCEKQPTAIYFTTKVFSDQNKTMLGEWP